MCNFNSYFTTYVHLHVNLLHNRSTYAYPAYNRSTCVFSIRIYYIYVHLHVNSYLLYMYIYILYMYIYMRIYYVHMWIYLRQKLGRCGSKCNRSACILTTNTHRHINLRHTLTHICIYIYLYMPAPKTR